MSIKVATLQDNIKKNNSANITNQAYWLGGTNTKNAALAQYDLLRTGYGRLFILRMPKFVEALLPEETKKFKHLLEYANVGISGISGYSVDFGSITAGYAGNTIEIPLNVKDDTNAISIKIYETSGSLIRTYIDFWLTGVGDPLTGLSHYHGARDAGVLDNTALAASLVASQANQTMEALYVATDQTGEQIEYACLLTNMFPKESDHSHFDYDPGSHDLVQMTLNFTASKYMSAQINLLGDTCIKKYAILRNYLNMTSGYTDADITGRGEDNKIDGWDSSTNGNANYDKGYSPYVSPNTPQ